MIIFQSESNKYRNKAENKKIHRTKTETQNKQSHAILRNHKTNERKPKICENHLFN